MAQVTSKFTLICVMLGTAVWAWPIDRALAQTPAPKSQYQAEASTAEDWAKIARTRAGEGRLEEALRAADEAVRLAPGDDQNLRMRIDIAVWTGDYSKAEADLDLLLSRHDDVDQLRRLAQVQSWQGKLDAASETLYAYRLQEPNDLEALLDHARIESWRGNYTDALNLLDDFRVRGGDDRVYREERAIMLAWADRPDEALRMTEGDAAEHTEGDKFLYGEAVAFARAGRHKESFESYERLSQLRPDGTDVHMLGRILHTPFRPYVRADIDYSQDSDTIERLRTQIHGGYHFNYETQVTGGVRNTWLTADMGSGLERTDGGEDINMGEGFVGLSQLLTPRWRLGGEIGVASVDNGGDTETTYLIETSARPNDALRLRASHNHHFHAVSPLALSLDVTRDETAVGLTYTPDLLWTFEAGGNFAEFSDGNERVGGYLAARRSTLRTETLKLDLGVSATISSFDLDLANGYYDPELFENYAAIAYLYRKIDDDNGVSLVLSLGAQRDEDMDKYNFAGNATVHGYFGIYRDWMLELRGGVSHGLSDQGSDYTAATVSASLVRRF